MSVAIPLVIGGATTAPSAPPARDFQDLYEGALKKARCSLTDADVVAFAKDAVNDLYELLCTIPDAPWMRKGARLTTVAPLSGTKATWTNGSATVALDATEALTAQQMADFVGGRIAHPSYDGFYFINAIPSSTSLTLDSPFTGTTTTTPLTDSWQLFADIYGLPGDLADLTKIASPTNPKLEQMPDVSLTDLYLMGVTTGNPHSWAFCWHGDGVRKLLLYPAPAQAEVLTLTYTPRVAPLVNDSDEPIVPAEHRSLLIYGAGAVCANVLREDAQLSSFLSSTYGGMLSKLVGKFAKDRPNTRFQLSPHLRPYGSKTLGYAGVRRDCNTTWDRE